MVPTGGTHLERTLEIGGKKDLTASDTLDPVARWHRVFVGCLLRVCHHLFHGVDYTALCYSIRRAIGFDCAEALRDAIIVTDDQKTR